MVLGTTSGIKINSHTKQNVLTVRRSYLLDKITSLPVCGEWKKFSDLQNCALQNLVLAASSSCYQEENEEDVENNKV